MQIARQTAPFIGKTEFVNAPEIDHLEKFPDAHLHVIAASQHGDFFSKFLQ
jgi:hypothetical protein